MQNGSVNFVELCVVPRYTTAWAQSPEGAVNRHRSWAIFRRNRCRVLPEKIAKGCDGNEELKWCLPLWEAAEVRELSGGVIKRQAEEQR